MGPLWSAVGDAIGHPLCLPFLPWGPTSPLRAASKLMEQSNTGLGARFRSQADTRLVAHLCSAVGTGARCKVPLFCHSSSVVGSGRLHKTGHIHIPVYIHAPIVGIYMSTAVLWGQMSPGASLAPAVLCPGLAAAGRKREGAGGEVKATSHFHCPEADDMQSTRSESEPGQQKSRY